MNILQDKHVGSIMTSDLLTVKPDTIMTEIASIFEEKPFHHLPVVGPDGVAVGIISRHDFNRCQHHFTQMKLPEAEIQNVRFFSSLLVKDIMIKDLVKLDFDDKISEAVAIFLQNKIHSIIICKEGKCAGILTPYDILKSLVEPALISKQ